MTARWLFRVALLISLAAAAANANELPSRIFHVGIVAGTSRSSPERVAFEDRLRELGYVEGRNLAIDFVQYDDLDRGAAAVGEMARRRVDVILMGGQDVLYKAAITVARSIPVVLTAVDSNPVAREVRKWHRSDEPITIGRVGSLVYSGPLAMARTEAIDPCLASLRLIPHDQDFRSIV